jgi:hypothetical protein
MVDDLLLRMSGAKSLKAEWAEVGELVRAGLKSERADVARGTSFLARAGEASGYSANALCRFAALLEFAEAQAATGRATLSQIRQVPFAILETVKRAVAHDPALADELIQTAAAGRLRLAPARAAHDRAAQRARGLFAARVDTVRQGAKIEQSVLDLVRRNLSDFTGSESAQLSLSAAPMDFVRVDAIAHQLQGNDEGFVDAFEVKMFSDRAAPAVVDDAVARLAMASTFYRRTWAILVEPSASQLSRYSRLLKTLELLSIGMAVVRLPTEEINIIKRPSGNPVPDRRKAMCEALLRRL